MLSILAVFIPSFFMQGTARALFVPLSLAVGFTSATGVMVQLDLAARRCPALAAGTLFALLMSLSNLGTSLSTWVGGMWYDEWTRQWGANRAFHVLVFTSAAFSAACWLLVPWLRHTASADEQLAVGDATSR